jgi:hypothetical protein
LRKAVAAAATAAFLLAAMSCGSKKADDTDAKAVAARLQLPQQVVGLSVEPEKVGSGLKRVDRPYVDTVAVFSLREKDLLRASLQINRFNKAARPEDKSFRQTIVSTIGGSAPLELRIDRQQVYATTASDQEVYTWFEKDGMFVLAVQKDFEFPRTLLRHLIELDLGL